MLMRHVKGFAFRLTGLILGIIGVVVSATAIVFASVGFAQAKHHEK